MRDAETIATVRMMRKEGKSYRKINRELTAVKKPEWTTPILTELPWNDDYARLYNDAEAAQRVGAAA